MIQRLIAVSRNLIARSRVEHALDEELESSVDLLAERHRRDGATPAEARRLAIIELGGFEQVKEQVRETRSGALIDSVLRDVRLGLRMMRRAPTLAAVVVLTLAVTIGLNTAVFTLLDTLVLRPLPFPAGDRLVALYNLYPRLTPIDRGQNSIPDYFDRRALTAAFESLALFVPETRNVGLEPSPISAAGWRVTPSAFDVLGIRPALGRRFLESESQQGHGQVAIISHGLWQRAFGGSSGAVGSSIRIDGAPHQVIGVLPPAFALLNREPDLLVPLVPSDVQRSDAARHGNLADMIGRLRPGVSVQQAQAAIDALNAASRERFPNLRSFVDRSGFRTAARDLREVTVRDLRPILLMLQAGALLVLVIGCANVGNLLLIRSQGRLQELAVRSALGAGRWRIARQLITEGLCLSTIGAAAGLGVASAVLAVIGGMLGAGGLLRGRFDTLGSAAIDGRVLAFAGVLALLSALAFGAWPAIQASGIRLDGLLRRAGRTGTGDRRASLTRGALVVTEVALAVILAVGAGLLGLSLLRAGSLEPGFEPGGVLTGRLTLSETAYPDDESVQVFARRIVDAVRTIPGVNHAAVTTVVPFSGDDNNSTVIAEEAEPSSPQSLPMPHNSWIAGDHFAALGIAVFEGRAFDGRDDASSQPVAIVDRVFAERNWPGRSPLGRRIRRGSSRGTDWLTVVGVVGSTKYHELTELPGHGSVYFPQTQPSSDRLLRLRRAMNLVVKADARAGALAQSVQASVLSVDPGLPLFDVQTMDERVASSLLPRRLPALLAGGFSGLGLLLAVLGVYGVSAFGVSQRMREIGIRLALGAVPAGVVRQVVARSATLVVTGVALGLGGALVVSRLLAGFLYGVLPADAGVMSIAVVTVLGAGLVGTLVPARRASRVDVVATLRQE